jgi:hypothetical protein
VLSLSRAPLSWPVFFDCLRDWRKLDINIEVIRFAAPNVVYVHLYWSGNWSVLTGWASSDGIPGLYESRKKLKTVTINSYQASWQFKTLVKRTLTEYYQGLESSERVTRMIDRFKAQINRQTKDGVKIDLKRRTSPRPGGTRSDDDLENLAGGRNEPPQHAWVERMEEFRRALVKLHSTVLTVKSLIPQRIKV